MNKIQEAINNHRLLEGLLHTEMAKKLKLRYPKYKQLRDGELNPIYLIRRERNRLIRVLGVTEEDFITNI